MTYRLHGTRGSGATIIEAACAELHLPLQLVEVDLETQAQRAEAYAALNPQRKIPTLETPDGETLTESVAILVTLDERHPQGGLLPPPASRERAQALRWLAFMGTELYPIIEIMDYPERFTPSADHAPAVRERAAEIWRARWLLVENAIAGEPYLLTSGFCATDLYIAVMSRWDGGAERRQGRLPRVDRLHDAVRERPALATVWQRNYP